MSVHTDRIFEKLNPQQREAVETLDGPLLILAGAGSGKTRGVTRRIANLIAHGARPWEILAITFTNKAAGEMRRRVEDLCGQSGVWLSTFHSFSARILRREAEALGFTKDFTIYDEEDASGILKDIVKQLGLGEDKRFTPRAVRQMISQLKSKAMRYTDMQEGLYDERVLQQIFGMYEKELQKNNALDFDDLLRQMVLLFKEHPDVLARYQDRFRFLLVDEYQDTNHCQYQIVKMLGAKHHNVCSTGDPDQSIYGWRGADVQNILSFEADFPEAKIVKLEQNYRSTKRILAAADAVIQHNKQRKHKSLWTENDQGAALSFNLAADEQLEAYQIARTIERHVREGRRYNEIAVFYRTNSQSRPIEEALVQATMPYQLIGGTAFYERKEIKDALAYLRLVVNPRDDVSFRRVVNVPKRSLGDSAVEIIEQEAARRACGLLETLDGPDVDQFLSLFKPKAKQGLIQFARLIDTLRAMPQFPVTSVLDKMLEKSGMRAALSDAGETERLENLEQLVNAAAKFDEEYDPAKTKLPDGPPPEPGAYDGMEEAAERQASLAGFLENSALLAPTDNFNPEEDRITLMTLHMAKGLEFPIVFLSGLEDGLLPMLRMSTPAPSDPFAREKVEDPAAIEEERRLMYVGMTRAMERLYLSRARYRMRFGKSDISIPSRFLSEIPDDLLESSSQNLNQGRKFAPFETKKELDDDDAFGAFEKEVAKAFSDDVVEPSVSRKHDPALRSMVDRMLDTSDSQEEPAEFEIGDKVRHHSFGDGIIESLSGSGLSLKAKVHFRGKGPKLLLLSHAKLEKI